MRIKTLLLLSLVLFFGMSHKVLADELTVYDGTNSNEYVPIYGHWADAYLKCEFVIPAADLAAMNGSSITALKFYLKTAAPKKWTGTFQIFLKEVDNTVMSAFLGTDDATVVYEGLLDGTSSVMTIDFTENYTYNGGNLLVGIYQTVKGVYASSSFYGVGQSYNSAVSGYNSTSLSNVGATGRAFIPKTTFVYEAAAEGPAFKVKGFNSGDTFNYPGLINPKGTTSFTLRNPGTESVTVNIATTGGFTASETTVTLAGKEEKTVSIEAPEAFGDAEGTVVFTPTATGLEAVTINLKATIKDPSKLFVDFSDGQLPADWTYTQYSSSYNWVYTQDDELGGYASYKGSSQSYRGTLTSPVLSFEENEKLYFKTSKYSSSSYASSSITIQTSTDGTTFTDLQTFTDDVYGEWTQRAVTIPAGTKFIRFSGWYFHLTHIYGGKLLAGAKFAIDNNSADFGMSEQNSEASKTFTVTNKGSEDMVITFTIPEGITVQGITDNKLTVPANNGTAAFSVILDTTVPGAKDFTLQLHTNAIDVEELSIPVSGYVMDNTLFTETFDGNALPDGWTMESGSTYTNYQWSFSNGTAIGTSTNARLITPALTVAEGEKMAIEIKKNNTWSCTLPIYISKDGGEFTLLKTIANTELSDTEYKVFYIDGLEAGNYKIRFDGNGIVMNAVNGFHLNQNAPMFEMVTTAAAAFGKKTESDSKTYTVKNAGTGTLTVNIASDNTTDFSVAPAQLNIAGGETADFTITFHYAEGNYGNKAANITVTPTYNESLVYTIAATAKAMDPNAWDEDFEGGAMPTGWVASSFSVTTKSYTTNPNSTYLAIASAKDATLITPRLHANEGDVVMWEAYYDWDDEGIKVEYSNDEKATWTVVDIAGLTASTATGYVGYYRPQDNGVTTRGAKLDMQFVAPAEGYYYLRFTSSYSGNGVDNFNGMQLAPKDHDAIISTQNIRATFTQYGDHQVGVTVKELAGKDEEMTAKFYIDGTQYGESVTETVPANGTKDFVIPVRLNEVISGQAYIVVSNENLELTSDTVEITTKAAIVLDELSALAEMPSGYQDKVVVKYTAKQGWNTICMPFALTDADLTALFGEGWKCYQLNGFQNGELQFSTASRRYAGYPYLVYCENVPEIAEPGYIITYVNFTSTAKNDQYGGATCQGTFAPIASGSMTDTWYGLIPSGHIKLAGANASLRGYHAYFLLPEGTNPSGVSMSVDGEVVTGIDALEMTNSLSGDVYDLSGRKVDARTAKRGVYIKDGKKIVVK